MPFLDWNIYPDWDTVWLGNDALPGVARVDVKIPSGLDVQKPKGGKRACVKDQGIPPAEISIELEMRYEHLAAFEKLAAVLRPKSVHGTRDPLEIAHPLTKLWGVNVVMVGEIGTPSPRAGGNLVATIELVEWVKQPATQKKSKKKPKDGQPWGEVQPLIDALKTGRQARVTDMVNTDDDGNAGPDLSELP